MPQTSRHRTSGDVIDAILDNMRRNLEELRYATLAPSRYIVYLSPAEYARIEGILPRVEAEARRALDEELARLNRPSWLRRRAAAVPGVARLPLPFRRRRPPLENAADRWHIEFLADPDGELAEEGDIIVHSDLMLTPQPDLGVGERTRRITTVHAGGRTTSRQQMVTTPATATRAVVHARLAWQDRHGRHDHDIIRDSTTIGRGGLAYPVDVRVASSEDVSREHARIRRDAATGQFYLIDLSTLGTTLNGRHVPRGVDDVDGTKRENGTETLLPDRARIGLADTIFLDFERVHA